ncbi:hypothetical protein OEIGOIKO_02221 [Streptomyces chrestomyceticus JCM 4735]|uniref:Uncharacterized protein n=1 Tax=Streptomyces chrestomyceticus JCM 4735 TaxID=1306181 RepID=A0A7U9KTF4_9ACTN|nr:hypothetical protein OEIGOIKO_02221 [Streptomyces chrestomyceticus JCM 4735]
MVSQKSVPPPSAAPGAATQWKTWNSGTKSTYIPSQCSGMKPVSKTWSSGSWWARTSKTVPNGHSITSPQVRA